MGSMTVVAEERPGPVNRIVAAWLCLTEVFDGSFEAIRNFVEVDGGSSISTLGKETR